jgi:predicted transcriptional regulator
MPVPPAMPAFERLVMEHVWDQQTPSVRSVMEAVNADESRPPRAYTTVLTVMQRLEAKGMIARAGRQGRFDVYVPAITREAYLRARADAEVDELIAEYGELALVQFARRAAALTDEQREALRRLAEE